MEGDRELSTHLLGNRYHRVPLVIGPTGYNGMVSEDGDVKLACWDAIA